jgi:hypothetical protein
MEPVAIFGGAWSIHARGDIDPQAPLRLSALIEANRIPDEWTWGDRRGVSGADEAPFKKSITYDAADYYKPEDDLSGYEDDNNEPL